MASTDNLMHVRYQLLARLVRMWKENRLTEEIDRLPIELYPRNGKTIGRCCIYKERAITKYKCMPMMGFDMSDEIDELDNLSVYAERMKNRHKDEKKMNLFCVMDEVCSSCVKINYEVSNLCRGCVAQACYYSCHKNAITMHQGKAYIDHEKCISCGKCHKACPFHAIIYVPVPCEESCPVKAITKDQYGVEHINYEKCIYCGKCLTACPFGAIFEVSSVFHVLQRLRAKEKVIAMVAPSILSQFNVPAEQVYGALRAIGFDDVIEVAVGAMETIRHEAEEYKERKEEGLPFMTTSCCSAYVELVKKHIPEMEKYISTTLSPMAYTALYAKKKHPNADTVFIGPCTSKRREARNDENVDRVWTMKEVNAVVEGLGIDMATCEPFFPEEHASYLAHGFAKTGGVFEAVKAEIGDPNIKATVIADLNKKNIALLRTYAKTGKCPADFIEIMACEGGCISGPCTFSDNRVSAQKFAKVMEEKRANDEVGKSH